MSLPPAGACQSAHGSEGEGGKATKAGVPGTRVGTVAEMKPCPCQQTALPHRSFHWETCPQSHPHHVLLSAPRQGGMGARRRPRHPEKAGYPPNPAPRRVQSPGCGLHTSFLHPAHPHRAHRAQATGSQALRQRQPCQPQELARDGPHLLRR